MDFTGALTQKIGPLPGYAYVLIGVGGIFLVRKLKPSNSSGYVPTSMAAGETPAPAQVANALDQPLPSNEQWALQAAQHLKLTSVFKASDISTALYNYLTGSGLTSAQENIVNAALAAKGFPSQGLLPVYAADIPTPTNSDYYVNPYVNMPYVPDVYTPNPYVPPSVVTPNPYVPPSVITPNPYVPPSVITPNPYVPPPRIFDPGFYVTPTPYVPPSVVTPNPYVSPPITTIPGVTYNPTQNLDRNYVAPVAPAYVAPVNIGPTQGTVDRAGIA